MRSLLILPACALLSSTLIADETAFFESRIRPVLVENCYECHSTASKAVKGGLLLDSRDAARKGGESGPAVVPGDVDNSLLLSAIRYESFEMPPSGRLSEAVVADFEHWIEAGAPDPRESHARESGHSSIDIETGRQFWAFQRPERHSAPMTGSGNPIDGFVQQTLQQHSMTQNPRADRTVLIRRLWLSVVGLPPDPETVDRFVADDNSDAWNRAVDTLLDSPHFGERWARMWLDVSRYAEDQAHIVGNNTSLCYPNAYLYRDWVIQSLNADMPYDRFVMLQLAADQLEPDDDTHHAALGFIGLGPKYYRRSAPEVQAEEWENQVDTLSRGLLGLTVACARCHDHKYDPIPTKDYYALAGVFAGTELFNRPLDEKREKDKNGHSKKPEDAIHVVRDIGNPADIAVHLRGNVENQGEVIPRGFPAVLCSQPIRFSSGSGRLELAQAIVDPGNPLTARVIVNRVWGELFGRAIVGTPSNFGELGDRPTHPELLDDLAVRFMENGWSLKWLCREIVTSDTWQQSSASDPATLGMDPENRWLSRMNRQRLSIEEWRDTVLVVSGQLDRRIGGRSIDPLSSDEDRRTVYSAISRLDLNPMLAMFDFPDANIHSGRRVRTTTPLQKMFLMNSPFMLEQADALAERCLSGGNTNDLRVRKAVRMVFGRDAEPDEVELALSYLGAEESEQHRARWVEFAQTLLASNELQFLD